MTRILYEQAHPIEGQDLVGEANSEMFILRMNMAFGHFPVELDKNHLERLEGMAAMDTPSGPYAKLIREIKRLGSIKVWANYGNDE